MARGFVNAQSPYWLRNWKWKLSLCRLRNHQRDWLPNYSLDSSAHIVPVDSEIVTKNCVGADSETINDTASTTDAWIRQRTKSLLSSKSQAKTESLPTMKPSTRLPPDEACIRPRTQFCWLGNHHRKLCSCRIRNHQQQCFQRWHVDSSAHKVHVDSKIESENWVAADSESINEIAFTTEAWIRPRTQSLLTRKSSPKT